MKNTSNNHKIIAIILFILMFYIIILVGCGIDNASIKPIKTTYDFDAQITKSTYMAMVTQTHLEGIITQDSVTQAQMGEMNATALPCPQLTPRWKPPKPSHTTIGSSESFDRVYVQFAEGTDIRLREGKLISLSGIDISQLYDILSQFDVQIERLYPETEEELDKQRRIGEAMSCKELSDKNLAYLFKLTPGEDTEKLIDLLNTLSIVELAEPVPIVVNP